MDPQRIDAEFVPVVDDAGRMLYMPLAAWQHATAQGLSCFPTTLHLYPNQAPTEWLTVKQAATMLMDVRSGMNFESARVTVVRAAIEVKFRSVGKDRQRRIEPNTFSAFLLKHRAKDLRQAEREAEREDFA